MVIQIFAQPLHHLNLLLDCQACNGRLNHPTHRGLVHGNKTLVIHECKESHDELAVHAISDSAVAWDAIPKIFDLEGPFETRGEEAAEGSDEGSEGSEDHDVELHGGDPKGVLGVSEGGKVVGPRNEGGIGGAF